MELFVHPSPGHVNLVVDVLFLFCSVVEAAPEPLVVAVEDDNFVAEVLEFGSLSRIEIKSLVEDVHVVVADADDIAFISALFMWLP